MILLRLSGWAALGALAWLMVIAPAWPEPVMFLLVCVLMSRRLLRWVALLPGRLAAWCGNIRREGR
ncbi:MAG TPA: hypothetical protein VMV33_17335 [Rhodocyclaceae bacterium]|nr:hypothetical protein [Rhodocyclaceae bacterium]